MNHSEAVTAICRRQPPEMVCLMSVSEKIGRLRQRWSRAGTRTVAARGLVWLAAMTPFMAAAAETNGGPAGLRGALEARGVTFGGIYTGEVLANVMGGLRRGVLYQGKLETFVAVDFSKLTGWNGLSFYSNQFQIHGTGGIGRDFVGNINTISNIEALPTTRLSELWLEQKFAGDKASIRFGQLTTDAEFFISDFGNLFVTADWPAITAVNLPSGGPAYPLSTPGVRLKVQPTDQLTILAALFNGDPSGPGPEDAEIKNRYGLNFRVTDPPLAITELQYKYNQEGTAPAGTIKLGAWHHFGNFADQRFATDGLPLASPASSGIPRWLRGNDGIYAVIDQQIYRPTGGGPDSGVAVFSRISGSPSDRNLIDFYLDGGIATAGLVPGRPDDKFGATFIYSRISDAVRGFDRDLRFYSGSSGPIRDYELTFELTYQAQIRPGWTVQPNIHYVIRPSGGVPDPHAASPAVPIRNALVLGVRSTSKF
jgi:porin